MFADVLAGLGQGAIYVGSGVVSAAIIGVSGYYNRKRRTLESKLDATSEEVKKISDAILGRAATAFDPYPPKGLSARLDIMQESMDRRTSLGDDLIVRFGVLSTSVETIVVEHAKRMKIGDKMIAEFEVWKVTQTKLDGKVSALTKVVDDLFAHVREIGRDSKALVYDSKRNNGSTSRDALARIEVNTKSAKDAVETISGSPEPVTLPDLADALERIEDNTTKDAPPVVLKAKPVAKKALPRKGTHA